MPISRGVAVDASVPIKAPFDNIAVHIVKPPRIREVRADRCVLAIAALAVRTIIVIPPQYLEIVIA